MLRIGSVILSLWTLLNLIPASIILVRTWFLKENVPGAYAILDEAELNALGSEALATMNSIGLFANGMLTGLCLLALPVIWLGLDRRLAWSFWALLAGFTSAWAAGFAADQAVGTVFPQVNAISAAILGLGFGCSAIGFMSRRKPERAPARS